MRRILTVLFVLLTMSAWQKGVVAQTAEEVAALRAFLSIESNAANLGLGGDDWRSNTLWMVPANGITVSAGRVVGIDWSTKSNYKKLKGELNLTALTALVDLNVNNTKITLIDVQGIASLKTLRCLNVPLSELKLRDNTNLEEINCRGTNVVGLNLTGLSALKTLDCSSSRLISLDVSANASLLTLKCNDNKLESLKINASLTTLDCKNNMLTPKTLPLPRLGLTYTYAPQDDISAFVLGTNLDLTESYHPENVYTFAGANDNSFNGQIASSDGNIEIPLSELGNNSLTCKLSNPKFPNFNANPIVVSFVTLPLKPEEKQVIEDLNGGPVAPGEVEWGENDGTYQRISIIRWSNKGITKPLSFPGFQYLKVLLVDNNPIPSLDVSDSPELDTLNCSVTNITSLNVSTNTLLTYLNCSETGIDALNLSANGGLMELNCSSTKITSLDLSANTQLAKLNCVGAKLTDLNLGSIPVEYIDCSGNQLTTIDIKNNVGLKTLICANNKITTFAPENATLLTLDCSGNGMTSLAVDKLAMIKYLTCSNNNLSSFAPTSGSITDLDCSSNNMTSLNVDGETALEKLICNNNNLTALSLTNHMLLQNLNCQDNKLWFSALDVTTSSWSGIVFDYAPQKDAGSIEVNWGTTVDLSAYGATDIKWYHVSDLSTPLSLNASAPNKYVIPESYALNSGVNKLVCLMKNLTYPNLTLKYYVDVRSKNIVIPPGGGTTVPEITTSLESFGDIVLCPGDSHTLYVDATGGYLDYEWTLNGEVINPTPGYPNQLKISNATSANSGTYKVRVWNASGEKISTTKVLVKGVVPTNISIAGLPTKPETNKAYTLTATKVDGAVYTWTYSNGDIVVTPTAENNVVKVLFKKTGKGKLTVSVETGCGGAGSTGSYTTGEMDVVEGQITDGIEEVASRNLIVYPNPVDAELQIKSDDMIRKVSVVSMSGSRVYTQQGLNTMELSINVSDWVKGTTYIVTVETEKGVSSHKVIKK